LPGSAAAFKEHHNRRRQSGCERTGSEPEVRGENSAHPPR